MNKPLSAEELIAYAAARITTKQAEPAPFQLGSVRYKMAEMNLADHVSMARNALAAVRDLAIPNGQRRADDDLGRVNANDLVDLLELITDRLGLALEHADG